MNLLPVFGVGGLRIAQSTVNKKTSKFMKSTAAYYQYGFYFETFAAIFSLIYFLVLDRSGFNIPTLICSAFMAVGFFLELITSLKALQLAPLPLCTLCAFGGGIVIPAIAGIFFFNEPLSIYQWGGMVLFFIAVYFLIFEPNQNSKISFKAISVLFVNFVVNGILNFLSKYFAINVENGSAALYSCLSYAFASLIFAFAVIFTHKSADKTVENEKSKRLLLNPFNALEKPLYIYGIIVGAVCATIVFSTTLLSRTIPIIMLNVIPTTISLIGSLFIGLWFFKEKITVKKVIGIVLSIISTAVITIL
ncbi:MAG: hypothetical protein IKB51_04230 [Clostridia bacterium]|nr:hypothetical protein [Clostridia bacterium]